MSYESMMTQARSEMAGGKTRIAFTVIGEAKPAGSKKGFAYRGKDGRQHVAVADANKKSEPWKAVVSWTARQHYAGALRTKPLKVSITIHVVRPAGHYGTGRNAGQLKASAPQHPAKMPDVLKLARGIEDALTGVLWRDDAQIVDEHIRKVYGDVAKVEIEVEEI